MAGKQETRMAVFFFSLINELSWKTAMELNISPNVYELQIEASFLLYLFLLFFSFFFSPHMGAQGLTLLSSSFLKIRSTDAVLTNYLRLPSLAQVEVLTNGDELICRLCSGAPIGYEFLWT